MKFLLVFFILAVTAPGYGKDVTLKWKAVEGAKKYNLEVSEDSAFHEKVFSKTISQPSLVRDLKSGMYYLRVQCVDERGKAGSWSPPFKLVVTAPIVAAEDIQTPKKVVFVQKKPDLEATWKNSDSATSYKVKIFKDGKEISSQETSNPRLNFKTEGAGDYKVMVSSGFQKYFGPAVTVSNIRVEKKELIPPLWNIPENKKYSNRRPINLAWTAVDTAHSYRVKVYRVADGDKRDPASNAAAGASDVPVFQTDKLENTQLLIDPLPSGKYYAVVESVSDEGSALSSTKIDLDVKRTKPVEFEKFDISSRYNFAPTSYNANIYEAGSSSSTSSLGGTFQIDGNLWLPESHWGVRAGGTWGGFTVNGTSITYNDLQAAAQYRLLPENNFLHSEIKPFIGGRAWTMPIVVAGGGNNNGNNNSSMQVFDVTLLGPVAGFEIDHPFSQKLAGVLLAQAAFPVSNSTIGNQAANNVKANFGVPSYKAEVGLKYALPGTLRLVAMAGYQDEQVQFAAFSGQNGTGSAPAGTIDSASIQGPTFSLGIEASDDGPLFQTAGSATARADRFSDFDLTMRYAFGSYQYAANIIESNNGASLSYGGLTGGTIEFDGRGWFKESHHGIRVDADWEGFNDQGAAINYPEFEIQWGWRPDTHVGLMGWSFNNFFGVRSWRVPILQPSGNSQGSSNFALFRFPQLVGPSETITVEKGLSETWTLRIMGEVSVPVTLVDKDSSIDHVIPNDMSWKAELQGVKAFTPDLSAGLGAGYTVSQINYAPSASSGYTGPGTSYVSITAPVLSVFGKYAF